MLDSRVFRPEDMTAFDMRPQDAIIADIRPGTRAWLGTLHAQSPAMTFTVDGAPIASIGIDTPWEGYGLLWCQFSKDLRGYNRTLARRCRQVFRIHLAHHNFRRVEAVVLTSDTAAVRFAEWLGMRLISVKPGYGPHGEHYSEYAIVREDVADV